MGQFTTVRCSSDHPDFVQLVSELDAFLAITDGEEHEFYDQFNKLTHINHVVVLYLDSSPVACGAFKEYSKTTVEIKRMYTRERYRGLRLAEQILVQLENWAADLGYRESILETGIRQTSAIALYERCGYQPIPCYGQYTSMANSRCYRKSLLPQN